MRKTLLSLSGLLLTSCLGGDNSGGSPFAPIPDTQILCSSTVIGCQTSQIGSKIYLGYLSQGLEISCDEFLHEISWQPPLRRHFDALASATAEAHFQVPGLYGLFNSWQGPLGQTVFSLERGTYRVCAFIDSNDNGRWDISEPFAQGTVRVGEELMPEITDWVNF